ncbi:MAG: hypothetical protein NT066_07465, partial [Candidatus Omnitrophica bacterium]|nr:hypothetical protein [Candidatus Omnitrophota bacterium]
MARKRRTVKRAQPAIRKDDDSKLFAWLATFFLIIGFIIALVTKKDNKYVMFYAKQSLVIFIAWIILGIGAA